jgi:hypothetical protein
VNIKYLDAHEELLNILKNNFRPADAYAPKNQNGFSWRESSEMPIGG